MCVGEYILVRMENIVNDSSLKGLVNELVEGRELTREIQLNLSEPHLSYDEAYGLIAKKILAKFENSLQILGYDSIDQLQIQFQQVKTETTDSPNSFSGSPKSQDSDGAFKGALEQKDESKKRKDRDNYYRVTQRLPSSPSSGHESPIEDGHNWRKYGQKDILGAKFPRAYYRCTFRLSQGCPATKHVQRSEDDPNFFDVTYRGKHTCSHASSSSSSSSEPNKQTLKLEPINFPSNPPHYPQNIMWDFKRSNYCNVKHDDKPINPNTIMGNYKDNNNNFVNHGNYPTYNTSSYTNTYQSCPLSNLINNNNYENHQQEVGLIQEIVQPLPSTSHPFLDHQGDDHFDGDFIIDDTNLFD